MRLVLPAASSATASAASRSPIPPTIPTRWCGWRGWPARRGSKEVVVGLTYSISPVHTHDYYVERAPRVAGSRGHRPALPQGPRRAAHPGRGARAGARFIGRRRAAAGRAAQPLHDRAGAAGLHRGAAGAGSGPCTRRSRRSAAAPRTRRPRRRCATSRPRASRTASTSRRWPRCREHFRELALERGLPLGAPAEYDAAYYRHQMPGGMVTTTRRMLEEMRPAASCSTRCWRRSPACARRWATRSCHAGLPVRGDAGGDERDRRRALARRLGRDMRYFLGHFCEPAGAGRPEVADRVLSLPRAAELRARRAAPASKARASASAQRISDEELLLRLTMPAEQVDAMVAARGSHGGAGSGRSPVVDAAARAGKRESVSLRAGRARATSWSCGAVRLDDVGGFVFDLDGTLVHRAARPGHSRMPGAVEVLAAIRASGRPLGVFTNGSHVAPGCSPRGLREAGLPSATTRSLTPVVQRDLATSRAPPRRAGDGVRLRTSARERMADAGVRLADGDQARGRVRGAPRPGRLRRDRGGGPRGVERRPPADRELPARRTGAPTAPSSAAARWSPPGSPR